MKKYKRKNPSSISFDIKDLQELPEIDIFNRLEKLTFAINQWTSGHFMYNEIPQETVDLWRLIGKAFRPYIIKNNKKIYRSVSNINKKLYGYYCSLDISNSLFQTSTKPLQNWSYSADFVDDWGRPVPRHLQIIFQSNIKWTHHQILLDTYSIKKYFSKIYQKFPYIFNELRKSFDYLITYLNGEPQELLLYSQFGEVYVESADIRGC